MSSIEEKADAERDDTMHHGEILTTTAIHQTCIQSFNNNNDDVDDAENQVVYEENRINLSLLDPSRFGWTALGGIADLLTPHEVRWFFHDLLLHIVISIYREYICLHLTFYNSFKI